jgi:Cu-processing system permease protein
MTAVPADHITERPQPRAITTIAAKELRETVRSRWFWLWTVAFAALAAILVTVALPGSEIDGYSGFGRTSASLVTLVQLIIPLMGLTLGALSIAGPRESGALRFLLSHPVSRTEAFFGTYLGLGAALAAATAAGFGVAGLITVAGGVPANTGAFLWIALLSWLLALAMLGAGMLISTLTRTAGAALGGAVFVWLILVFVGDLGLMGTAAATRMPVNALFGAALLNPIEAFRLAALTTFAGSLDVLGPAGTYAMDTLGDALLPVLLAVLTAWVIAPLAVAWFRFHKGTDL